MRGARTAVTAAQLAQVAGEYAHRRLALLHGRRLRAGKEVRRRAARSAAGRRRVLRAAAEPVHGAPPGRARVLAVVCRVRRTGGAGGAGISSGHAAPGRLRLQPGVGRRMRGRRGAGARRVGGAGARRAAGGRGAERHALLAPRRAALRLLRGKHAADGWQPRAAASSAPRGENIFAHVPPPRERRAPQNNTGVTASRWRKYFGNTHWSAAATRHHLGSGMENYQRIEKVGEGTWPRAG